MIENFRKVFVFRWKGLGDIILDTPFLRALKTNFPHIELNVISKPEYQKVLIGNPFIDNIYPKKNFSELTHKKCDLFIDFMGNTMTLFLFFILRPKIRMGYKKKLPFLNLKMKFEPTEEYTVNHRLKLLKLLKVKEIPYNSLPETYLKKEEEETFKEKFRKIIKEKPYVTILPFARGRVRDFKDEIFAFLNDKLQEKNYNVLFLFNKEGEKKFERIKKLCKKEVKYIKNPDLRELIFILKNSSLHIGPDSGPKHIAVSQKTKTLTFFTHTNPLNWTPPDSKNHKVITPEIECHPCETPDLNYCKRKDFKCLSLFEKEKIFCEAMKMLEGGEKSQRKKLQ